MQFDLMFGVMLILPIPCFVCIATTSSEDTCHLKSKLVPGNLKSQASCALDHFFLPTHVLINHNDLHRLILMGPNRLP
jgi:hypothetical protein